MSDCYVSLRFNSFSCIGFFSSFGDDSSFLDKIDIFGIFSKDEIEVPNFINMDFDEFMIFQMIQEDENKGSSGDGSGAGCGSQLAALFVIVAFLSILGGACG